MAKLKTLKWVIISSRISKILGLYATPCPRTIVIYILTKGLVAQLLKSITNKLGRIIFTHLHKDSVGESMQSFLIIQHVKIGT